MAATSGIQRRAGTRWTSAHRIQPANSTTVASLVRQGEQREREGRDRPPPARRRQGGHPQSGRAGVDEGDLQPWRHAGIHGKIAPTHAGPPRSLTNMLMAMAPARMPRALARSSATTSDPPPPPHGCSTRATSGTPMRCAR